jgi:hypothetical protein
MLATVRAARICDLTASVPCCLFFLPWLAKMLVCGVLDKVGAPTLEPR